MPHAFLQLDITNMTNSLLNLKVCLCTLISFSYLKQAKIFLYDLHESFWHADDNDDNDDEDDDDDDDDDDDQMKMGKI